MMMMMMMMAVAVVVIKGKEGGSIGSSNSTLFLNEGKTDKKRGEEREVLKSGLHLFLSNQLPGQTSAIIADVRTIRIDGSI